MAKSPLQKLLDAEWIDAEAYLAALEFMSDVAPAGGSSNTAAICETASRLSIDKGKLRRQNKARLDALNSGAIDAADIARNELVVEGVVGTMSCKDESGSAKNYAANMLRRVQAIQRYERDLEKWQIALLEDFLVKELSLHALAVRWGTGRKAMRRKVIETLFCLAVVQERTNKNYQSTLAHYRQMTAQ